MNESFHWWLLPKGVESRQVPDGWRGDSVFEEFAQSVHRPSPESAIVHYLVAMLGTNDAVLWEIDSIPQ